MLFRYETVKGNKMLLSSETVQGSKMLFRSETILDQVKLKLLLLILHFRKHTRDEY